MSRPKVISLGCRLNAFESEFIREHSEDQSNTIIINTCAVTAEAERQARQTIRRVRRNNPDARLIVTGCAAQLDPKGYGNMPEVNKVLGNREKLNFTNFSSASENDRISVKDIMKATETAPQLISGFEGRARAFVEIQQGCDHRCTFCIIPFARGPNRSVCVDHIVKQVQLLTKKGFKEIVLTGVDICSFGADVSGTSTLGELIQHLLSVVPDLPRLRLSSLDPAKIDAKVFEVLANEPRLMPHLHLSVQALDDTILKRMKRRHLRADVENVISRAKIARPGVVFGADLIAGFPTETENQFNNTVHAVKELELTHLHVFPYSQRIGTPAARMPPVPITERKFRAKVLREVGDTALKFFMANHLGHKAAVLIENKGQGRSEHYAPVKIKGKTEPGKIQHTTLTGVREGFLVGRPS